MAVIALADGSGYGNPYLDSLIWGCLWNPDPGDPPGPLHISYFFGEGTDPHNTVTGRAWQAHEQTAFRTIFQLYENVANLVFDEVDSYDEADTVEWLVPSPIFGNPSLLGYHELPDPSSGVLEPLYGYYYTEATEWAAPNLAQGGYGFLVAMHELGHMLGLAHPHDGGDHSDATTFPGVTLDASADKGDFGLNQGIWTTMSYNAGWDKAPSSSDAYGWQGTPMAFDIAALQALYGANMTFHTGDDVYALPTVNAPGTFWSCIWDAGGTKDEISGANALGACSINLNAAPLTGPNAGGFVSWMVGIRGGFTIANGVVIENASGGKGNDTLTGNDWDNVLTGNSGGDSLMGGIGSDTLDGGAGIDRMVGGSGDDVYWVDMTTDLVSEAIGGGADTVNSFITLTLGTEVENLELQGSAAINGNANALANILVGNSGANMLDGKVGADTLKGGLGNDTYIIDDEKDATDETGGGGNDLVKSSAATYTLSADIERLTLTGTAVTAIGNEIANIIIGTVASNKLSGFGGDDSLSGDKGDDTLAGGDDADTLDGGAGIDMMTGGAGSDLYRIDLAGDIIGPGADDGIDTVESKIAFTLGAEQERLTLLGTAAINGTGNDGDNIITGNIAANILSGGSNGETDTLIGGGGNDTYLVDASNDKVTEADKGGTDLVKSLQTFTLSDDGFVENLTLLGAGNIDGTGNGLANVITGNAGNNKLSGSDGNDTLTGGDGNDTLGGGIGNDVMTGGNDDDIYEVDGTADRVTESSAVGGRDKVESAIAYTLGANVEDLKLTSGAAVNGTGNALDNLLVGGDGANKLDGKVGADTMRGEIGDDIYVIDNLKDVADETGGDGSDTIQIATALDLMTPTIAIIGAIENVTLTGTAAIGAAGDAGANHLTGNSGANALSGRGGADTLDGLGGADIMNGGTGNDTYVIDNAKDVVQELAGDAADLIKASIAIDLAAYAEIEDVTLIGAGALKATGDEQKNRLTGNVGANLLSGNDGADTLVGDAGNDTLDGGTGTDSLAGGLGNDTYKVDSSADVVIEVANGGTDTVLSTAAAFTLTDANVENLTLLVGAVEGFGNGGKNKLTGNDLANTLDGGLDADTLVGGKGDDLYLVNDAKDVVTEAAGVGTGVDTVTSTAFGYTLGVNIEKLVLGAGAVAGTGNTLDNTLTGNSGDNTIDGKAGKDHMAGNAGNDSYVVDNVGDVVDEGGGLGGDSDTVNSSISFSLVAGTAVLGTVENLSLTGAAAISGTGNALANKITGNAGANALLGGGDNDTLDGGAGADTLDGGAGNDAITGGAGNDRIDVGTGDDMVFYTSKLDGKDIINNFDGDLVGGQDVLNLDALFDKLTLTGNREDHVSIVVNATGGVDVRVDADGKVGFELVVATLNLANPADSITVGQDVLVGS